MTFFHRFFRYIRPSVDPDTARDIDYQSMGNIRMIALVSLVFEVLTLITFLASHIRSFDHDAMISTVTVSYSILLCALAVFFSSRILKNKKLVLASHFFALKEHNLLLEKQLNHHRVYVSFQVFYDHQVLGGQIHLHIGHLVFRYPFSLLG